MSIDGLSATVIVLAIVTIVTLASGVRTVPQGYNYTVERFRRYARTLGPGLGLILPFIEGVGHKVNMMEQVIEVPSQEAITKDNASVRADGVAFYQILDAAKASYEITDLENALLNLVTTNVRTVMGSMDLDQLLSHRDEINERLLKVVDAAVSPWGVKINRIEIKDIIPPPDLSDSMNRQMKAERDRRASILEAEGQRQAEILRAEGRKQAQILEAEGRKEAAFRDAEARERQAEAEAKSTGLIAEAIGKGDLSAANYLIAEKYINAIAGLAAAPNQKVVVVPVDMAGVAGSIAGVTEIAKAVFGPDAAGRPRGRVPDAGQA